MTCILRCRFVLTKVLILNALRGAGAAQSDSVAPAGNQQLICLRSPLINMDNSDPQNGWGFLSNWITVSLLASKYCLELIPLSVARNYLHYIRCRVFFFSPSLLNCNLAIGSGTKHDCVLPFFQQSQYRCMFLYCTSDPWNKNVFDVLQQS